MIKSLPKPMEERPSGPHALAGGVRVSLVGRPPGGVRMTMESPCGDSWQALGTLLSVLVTCPFCIRTAAGGSEGSSNCPATLPCE